MRQISTDVAVIGGGPAGLAAAISAKKAGVKNVLLIERAEQLGGLLHQCIHNGFGLQYFSKDLSGPEYADEFLKIIDQYHIDIYLETMALNITPDKEIFAVNSSEGTLIIKAKAIILAMGCRERSRGAINIPGSRPAGILTAGTAQRFINVEGYFPGKKIVILGSGDIGMIMARRVILEGAEVKAVVEILPYIGGLVRNEIQCLKDFEVPVYIKHTVTKIHGNERIEKVTIAEVDSKNRPIKGTEQDIECDTLLLSVGLIPENEVSKTAGVELSQNIGGPVVDENMQTNIPGIFAAGNVVHVHDLVDYVTLGGEIAGQSAASYISGKLKSSRRRIKVEEGKNIRYVVPQYISEEGKVTLYMRVGEPAEEAMLRVNPGLFEKKVKNIKPSEMIKIDLNEDKIDNLNGNKIQIECPILKKEKEENLVEKSQEIICLVCPIACRIRVFIDGKGEITEIKGYKCKKGIEYAEKEIQNPERVLTATVRTNDPKQPLLSVRTSKEIPKKLLFEVMAELSKIIVVHPVKVGQTIKQDLLGQQIDIVSTVDFPFKYLAKKEDR
jgi:thioredoxin reductase/CxxC motif-containing protein